jgi:hypothetical protein
MKKELYIYGQKWCALLKNCYTPAAMLYVLPILQTYGEVVRISFEPEANVFPVSKHHVMKAQEPSLSVFHQIK